MPKVITTYPNNQFAASFIVPDPPPPTLFERLGWAMVWFIYLWLALQVTIVFYRAYWR